MQDVVAGCSGCLLIEKDDHARRRKKIGTLPASLLLASTMVSSIGATHFSSNLSLSSGGAVQKPKFPQIISTTLVIFLMGEISYIRLFVMGW